MELCFFRGRISKRPRQRIFYRGDSFKEVIWTYQVLRQEIRLVNVILTINFYFWMSKTYSKKVWMNFLEKTHRKRKFKLRQFP